MVMDLVVYGNLAWGWGGELLSILGGRLWWCAKIWRLWGKRDEFGIFSREMDFLSQKMDGVHVGLGSNTTIEPNGL